MKEFVDKNVVLSIVIGAAALCLCLSCCIFMCCCCNYWRNNKKRKARHDKIQQDLPMTHVNLNGIESAHNNGAHANPPSAPNNVKTKPLAPPSNLPTMPFQARPHSQRSLNDDMDWANPDNYGKWTGSQASILTTDNGMDDRNMVDYHENEDVDEMKDQLVPKDQRKPSSNLFDQHEAIHVDSQNGINTSQDNIRREESDSDDSLMRKQQHYMNNPDTNSEIATPERYDYDNSGLYHE